MNTIVRRKFDKFRNQFSNEYTSRALIQFHDL